MNKTIIVHLEAPGQLSQESLTKILKTESVEIEKVSQDSKFLF